MPLHPGKADRSSHRDHVVELPSSRPDVTDVTNGGDSPQEHVQTADSGVLGPHNDGVKRTDIEPGLLRLMQWFVTIRLAWLVFLSLAEQPPAEGELLFVPMPGIVAFGLLLIFLVAAPIREAFGRWHLPIAVTVATLSMIIENGITVAARIGAGYSANEAISDYWMLFFLLFVPLIVVAWQYKYRWVVVFAVVTFFLDAIATLAPLDGTNADLTLVGGLLLLRAGLFVFIGFVLVRLVKAVRDQREELAELSVTRERLAMSEERRRLARELHDTLAHSLSAVAVQLEGVKSLWSDDPARAEEMLDRSLESARTGLTEARRSIQALRASPLEEGGLRLALEDYVNELVAGSDLHVELDADDPGRFHPNLEHNVFRIATEAVTNAVRHADADRIRVWMRRSGDQLSLAVQDNGGGFDTAEANGGHGLDGMRERAELIGGTLEIQSVPKQGSTVLLRVETA